MTVVVLCGGVGAAKFVRGLLQVVDPELVTAVVNVADDTELHGLHISPDLDTVTYTLADAIDPERGWGLRDETWHAMTMFERYGNPSWFNLGDRDLATHIVRTQRLGEGQPLSSVTAQFAVAWDLRCAILPVTDDRVRTYVSTDHGELAFQDYFVGRRHEVAVRSVRFEGIESSTPAPGVLDAIATADQVIVAPSNPIVSIGPVLAVPGVREAVAQRRADVVAVSPIVAGAALKGPADRMLSELGHEPSAVGVAALYRDLVGTFVIDDADADRRGDIEALGVECVVTDTIMSDVDRAAALARLVVGAA